MFKNIKAQFKAIGKDAYDGKEYDVIIERHHSGANPYGDESAHSIQFNNDMPKYFDTRYERIKPDKEYWVNYWIDYLMEEYLIKSCELISYEEME